MQHVTDLPLGGKGQGQTTTGASAAVAPSMTGAGYLTILNADASAAAYLTFDGSTASAANTSFKLPAGAGLTKAVQDVTKVKCFGTGTVLSWAFDKA